MSFKAIFEIDGNQYRVLSCSYSLHQDIDITGRPSSVTRGGVVHIVIESTADTSLFEWMVNSYEKKDASVTFNKRDEDAQLKKLEIEEAYLVSFEESFDDSGSGAMIQSLALSARCIKVGGIPHENEWPV